MSGLLRPYHKKEKLHYTIQFNTVQTRYIINKHIYIYNVSCVMYKSIR